MSLPTMEEMEGVPCKCDTCFHNYGKISSVCEACIEDSFHGFPYRLYVRKKSVMETA
jgi:hypothetical protein